MLLASSSLKSPTLKRTKDDITPIVPSLFAISAHNDLI